MFSTPTCYLIIAFCFVGAYALINIDNSRGIVHKEAILNGQLFALVENYANSGIFYVGPVKKRSYKPMFKGDGYDYGILRTARVKFYTLVVQESVRR